MQILFIHFLTFSSAPLPNDEPTVCFAFFDVFLGSPKSHDYRVMMTSSQLVEKMNESVDEVRSETLSLTPPLPPPLFLGCQPNQVESRALDYVNQEIDYPFDVCY